ncbi:hypothetical protein M8C21_031056 [Ambrosia artemisiifolia]|uniref:Uncharacterized protein n=1 Tax=Ambrosia artemisiifolia TaxID=4212 RepID=A0AAD5CGD2_AMBAR|nr:hypothetical protein M8C21_031056 [Ambrosia artemisiifolia]
MFHHQLMLRFRPDTEPPGCVSVLQLEGPGQNDYDGNQDSERKNPQK